MTGLDKVTVARYERKFVISELRTEEIEFNVKMHPAMFVEKYPERFVNNLYFDSLDRRNYEDSVDGLQHRLKVRIRWYGDLFGFMDKPVLEVKRKEGLVTRKKGFRLVPFSLDENFQIGNLREVIQDSKIPEVLKLGVASSEASLLNRYRRKYFESANGRYRITIDFEMEFYPFTGRNNFPLHRSAEAVNTVLELKYDPEADEGANWRSSYFPFRISKSSKYVDGIEKLYRW